MSATVKLLEHFKKLLDFRGREDRISFWPYAALVYGIMTVASYIIMMPTMTAVMQTAVTAAAKGATEPVFPDMSGLVGGMIVTNCIGILLFAAAVARRLHDGGLSGLWGLMPLPFMAYSMSQMRAFFRAFSSFGTSEPDMARFNQMFLNNSIYLIALIALIVLLARRSDPGPNRFDR